MCVYVYVHNAILLSHQKKNKRKEKEKEKEILSFATAWMELKGIMLSEISPSEKDIYHMISLRCGI